MVEQPSARRSGGCCFRQHAPQNGQDGRRSGRLIGQARGAQTGRVAAMFGDVTLHKRDHFDHQRIGVVRGFGHREDAVLGEQKPLHGRVALEDRGGGFRKLEAGHDVRHKAHTATENPRADGLGVRQAGNRGRRDRMGMIDELMRQIGVQKRFDRRIGSARIEQILPLRIDHLLVGEGVETAQTVERLSPHCGMAVGLDHRQVAPAALDAKHIDGFAEEIGQLGLHRSIAAAMHDQARHAAEQAGGIGAQSQILADALGGVMLDAGARIVIGPKAIHCPHAVFVAACAAACLYATDCRSARRQMSIDSDNVTRRWWSCGMVKTKLPDGPDVKQEMKPESSARMRRDALAPPGEFGGDPIVWVAWLYYEEGMTQEEIARALGISRGSVVTMLQEARESGVVSISVAPQHLQTVGLARDIMRRFGIDECFIVPSDGGRVQEHERVGRAAARLLAERLKPDDVLGVSWGRTVLALSQAMQPKLLPGVSVVQITGECHWHLSLLG